MVAYGRLGVRAGDDVEALLNLDVISMIVIVTRTFPSR
jgi:Iap family predicted aminopeptidase